MVEILHYEKVTNKNKTIGYVDIKLQILKPTTIILRKVSHVQSGEKKWFNMAAFPREASNKLEYFKYFQFEEDEYNKKLLSSLQLKVDEFCKKHNLYQEQETLGFPSFIATEEDIPF